MHNEDNYSWYNVTSQANQPFYMRKRSGLGWLYFTHHNYREHKTMPENKALKNS